MGDIPIRARIKMCKFKAVTDGTGKAVIILPVPVERRVLKGGVGWFSNPHPDDYIVADIVLLSNPDTVVKTMYEDTIASSNEGWFFPPGYLQIHPIDEPMIIDYGAQLRLTVFKGDGSVDTIRGNIEWGEP